MSDVLPTGQSQVSLVAEGASVQPVYTRRKMMLYAINENEITIISTMNSQATTFFAVASFLASLGIGIFTNAAFYDKLTPAGQLARSVAAPVLLVLAAVFLILGGLNIKARQKLWRDIRVTSRIGAVEQDLIVPIDGLREEE